jgi:hypothetical protein
MHEEEAEARPKLHTVETTGQPKAATPLTALITIGSPEQP